MASCPTPKRAKCSVRHHLQLSFPSQATKEAFLARLDRAKQRMFPEGGTIDNCRLLTCLLDALEGQAVGDEAQTEGFGTPAPTAVLDSSGRFCIPIFFWQYRCVYFIFITITIIIIS